MKELPKSLDLFYERSLQDISQEDYDFAYIAFQWLAFAFRPLTLDELAIAMAINPKGRSFQDDRLDSIEVLEILPVDMVKVFTESGEVSNSSYQKDTPDSFASAKVQFAHYSVKEYLLSTRIGESPVSRFQVKEAAAHHTLSKQCLVYLLYVGQPIHTSSFGFFWYAASHWPWHLHVLESHYLSAELQDLALDFFASKSKAWATVMQLYMPSENWNNTNWQATPEDWAHTIWASRSDDLQRSNREIMHPLMLAAQLGLHDLVLLLLAKIPDVDEIVPVEEIGGPLHCAARGGHPQIVRTLLAHGASIDAENSSCGTPLYETVKLAITVHRRTEESLEICRLLLQEGANVNAETGLSSPQCKEKQSPLVAAVRAASLDIVQLFLEKGAEPNFQLRTGETALEIAINEIDKSGIGLKRPNASIIQMLLEHGANANISSGRGSLLHRALRFHGLEIIRLLLEYSADIHSPNALETVQHGGRKFSLPLSQHVLAQVTNGYLRINWIFEASVCKYWRNLEVVDILLDAGADPRREGLWAYLLQLKKNNGLGNMTAEQFAKIETKVRAVARVKVKSKRKIWERNEEWIDANDGFFGE